MAWIDSHIAEYKKGEHIIRQGQNDSTIFVLLNDNLAITKDEVLDAELNTLNLGAIFGEVALITGKSRSTNVIGKKKVVVLKMYSYLLKTLDPAILNKFKDHILKILIGRLDEMNIAMAFLNRDLKRFIVAYKKPVWLTKKLP